MFDIDTLIKRKPIAVSSTLLKMHQHKQNPVIRDCFIYDNGDVVYRYWDEKGVLIATEIY